MSGAGTNDSKATTRYALRRFDGFWFYWNNRIRAWQRLRPPYDTEQRPDVVLEYATGLYGVGRRQIQTDVRA